MKIYIRIVSIFIVLMSCQDHNKNEDKSDFKTESEKRSKQKAVDDKAATPIKMIAKAEFDRFFPHELAIYNLIEVGESEVLGTGKGTYIKGKDYGTIMYYYVSDGYKKGSAAIKSFEESYQSNQKWSDGSERINKERDGFKTVALLRTQYNNYKISTLYNGRFVLTVEGHEKPDVLWSYLKQANLKILDAY